MASTDQSNTAAQAKKLHWDDAKMQTNYANVCNVSGTREELTLLFGTNQNWHAGQKDFRISLSNRIILSPFAAKRLQLMLDAAIQKYEVAFGDIVVEQTTVEPS